MVTGSSDLLRSMLLVWKLTGTVGPKKISQAGSSLAFCLDLEDWDFKPMSSINALWQGYFESQPQLSSLLRLGFRLLFLALRTVHSAGSTLEVGCRHLTRWPALLSVSGASGARLSPCEVFPRALWISHLAGMGAGRGLPGRELMLLLSFAFPDGAEGFLRT